MYYVVCLGRNDQTYHDGILLKRNLPMTATQTKQHSEHDNKNMHTMVLVYTIVNIHSNCFTTCLLLHKTKSHTLPCGSSTLSITHLKNVMCPRVHLQVP